MDEEQSTHRKIICDCQYHDYLAVKIKMPIQNHHLKQNKQHLNRLWEGVWWTKISEGKFLFSHHCLIKKRGIQAKPSSSTLLQIFFFWIFGTLIVQRSNFFLFFSCFLATKLNTEITKFSPCFKKLAINSHDMHFYCYFKMNQHKVFNVFNIMAFLSAKSNHNLPGHIQIICTIQFQRLPNLESTL